MKKQIFNNINYKNIIHNNSFDSLNTEISLFYNVKHNRFLEILENNSDYNGYNYLSSSYAYKNNIDFTNPEIFQNSRMFAVIQPLFNLYKPKDNNIISHKLIYCIASRKLLKSNNNNSLLKNNLNIFKYLKLKKNNNKYPIELYPNCLTGKLNSIHHYTNKININMLKNIYNPSITEYFKISS